MSTANRRYDLVVWGATGVAGQLVVEYLTEQYSPDKLSLCLGGRNEDRLRDVETDATAGNGPWEEIPIVLGDATDPASLRNIVRDTQVICSTVGPYTEYGTPLVEACVEAGTDYCDLTGEINWVRETIDRFHEQALDAGARIIHSCGFDSIPADLGTLLVQSFAIREYGHPCDLVQIYLEEGNGSFSGGTLASAAALFEAASTDPRARETLQNPYSLAPPQDRYGPDSGAQRRPERAALRSGWTAPSPMAVVNERVVRRSNALLEYPWGRDFRCSEVIPTGDGPRGAAVAGVVAAGLGATTAGLSSAPLRSAMQRYLFPDPGEGPSGDDIEEGYFTVRILGRGIAADGPFTVEGQLGADVDPGYGATARMLSESAMALVTGDTSSPFTGGVLTPASGIGEPLAGRLRDAGLTAEVGELSETSD